MHAESVACKVILEHVDVILVRAVGEEDNPLRTHPNCVLSAHKYPGDSSTELTAHEGSSVRIAVIFGVEAAPALAMNRQAVSQKQPPMHREQP